MAKAVKKTSDIAVIDVGYVPSEDERIATEAGTSIAVFMASVRAFFKTASEIEDRAKDTLAKAKALKLPATMEEDEQVQTFIKDTSIGKRTALEHWEPLTSTLSGWHKRSTAGRARAVTAYESANAISNELHTKYVEAEKQRAREEQERIWREAQEKARIEREAETARMEAEALKAEQASPDLSARERAFVEMVVSGMVPKEAAKYAGYKSPVETAGKLLGMAKIDQAITARQMAKTIREQAAAVQAQPLEVGPVETVRANISRADGMFDRSTWAGELVDEKAFIDAILSGKYGLDRYALLTVKGPALNDLAQSMHELLDRIPGVRAKKTTKAIGR